MPLWSYEVEVIKHEDKGAILDLLRTFFIRDAPLSRAVGLLEGRERCEKLENFLIEGFDNGLSLKATSNNKIVGVAINDIITRGYMDQPVKIDHSDEKLSKCITLVAEAGRRADVFSHFPGIDRALEVKVVTVDGSMRGAGIATALMDKTRQLARREDCGFITVECTSDFSARAAKRLGFQCVFSLKYKDYKVNGEVAFVPEAPHDEIAVFAQKL